ncbi:hypothetical protein KJB62_10760 [Staphylococcus saprophyticus]|uniref:hypothetical protein n=1 Tax=Staphylococcus saprophyticus TaxID=29385 RepID=UPI001F21CF22|nr:hypothetical protein [Staphylococcus saprophyticus]MCE5131871.1 hypothetical protein [Staphylococcus saprophyticus]
MKNIRNEIIVELLHRIKHNFIPALFSGITVIILCLVGGSYFVKSKIELDSFIESFHILITSLLPLIAIGFSGFIIFIIVLLLEDSL